MDRVRVLRALRRASAGGMLCVATFAATAFDQRFVDDETRVTGGFGFGPDGVAYLIDDRDDTTIVKRINLDGSVAWASPFEGNPIQSSEVDVAGGRACVAVMQGPGPATGTGEDLDLAIACVDVTTGALIWRTALDIDVIDQRPALHVDDDGDVIVLYLGEGGLHHARFDATGAVGTNTVLPTLNGFFERPFANDGSALVAHLSDTGPQFARLDRDGVETTRFSAATLGLTFINAVMAPDGTMFVQGLRNIATIGSTTLVFKILPSGAEAWRRELRDEAAIPGPPVFGDGAVFFQWSDDAGINGAWVDPQPPYTYYALDYATGATRWAVDVPPNRQAFYNGTVSTDGDTLMNTNTLLNNKVRVQSRSTATGAITRDSEYDCGLRSCSTMALHGDATGRLRVILRANDGSTSVHAVVAVADADVAPTMAIDQRGLRGAWNVNTNGQGLVFDFDPASGTLFAPWFTVRYIPPGTNTTTEGADLRWYTLQATLAPDTRVADVTIFATTGGTFASGAPINGQRVGAGTLTFESCGRGALAYSFDGEDGAQGLLGLSRLTPRTDACVDPVGTTQPPEVTPASANGFARGMSGSWSQVGSAGQGLELIVQPTASITGAWFTFDRAGAADDPGQQNWFTLQGSLAEATGGVAEVTIFATTGGSFDFRPATTTAAVGTATIRFQSCVAAELQYTFHSGQNAGLTGTIALEHLGGCGP